MTKVRPLKCNECGEERMAVLYTMCIMTPGCKGRMVKHEAQVDGSFGDVRWEQLRLFAEQHQYEPR